MTNIIKTMSLMIVCMIMLLPFQNCSNGNNSNSTLSAFNKGDCEKDGIHFKLSETLADACNVCECTDDGMMCTDKDCEKDGSEPVAKCKDGDTVYNVGDSFDDGCNTCNCTVSGVMCTLMACAE